MTGIPAPGRAPALLVQATFGYDPAKCLNRAALDAAAKAADRLLAALDSGDLEAVIRDERGVLNGLVRRIDLDRDRNDYPLPIGGP